MFCVPSQTDEIALAEICALGCLASSVLDSNSLQSRFLLFPKRVRGAHLVNAAIISECSYYD